MGRQTLPRAMGVSLAGLAFSPSPASLIASPRFAHAVAMRVRLISTSRRPIGTRVSDAVLLTAPVSPSQGWWEGSLSCAVACATGVAIGACASCARLELSLASSGHKPILLV